MGFIRECDADESHFDVFFPFSFSNVATIIEGILYGEVYGEISSTKDLLEFLNKNKDCFVVLTDYEEDTTNEKLWSEYTIGHTYY